MIPADELVKIAKEMIDKEPHIITLIYNHADKVWYPLCSRCGSYQRNCPKIKEFFNELKNNFWGSFIRH